VSTATIIITITVSVMQNCDKFHIKRERKITITFEIIGYGDVCGDVVVKYVGRAFNSFFNNVSEGV